MLWSGNGAIRKEFPFQEPGWEIKPEDQWSCKRSPESAAYTNKHV